MDVWTAIGLAFVVFVAIIQAFAWTVVQAGLIVGLICIAIGVLTNGPFHKSV